MGGYGSGSWLRYSVQETVEDTAYISVQDWVCKYILPSGGEFVAGLRRDRRRVSVGHVWGRIERSQVYARVSLDGAQKSEAVRFHLDRTSCHYGGGRFWFRCPSCNKRRTKLYYRNTWMQCRECHRLPYRCQQLSQFDRAAWTLSKIKRRLGDKSGLFTRVVHRPKGMHAKTFSRLSAEAHTHTHSHKHPHTHTHTHTHTHSQHTHIQTHIQTP